MNTEMLNKLRDVTGLGVMKCSNILKECGGDYEKALISASKISAGMIGKLIYRTSGSGRVFSYIHTGSKRGAMVHLFSETDFVSNTDEFINLGNDLAMHVAAMEPKTIEELIEQPFVKDGFVSVNQLIQTLQIKVGEKIEIKNFCFMSS